VRESIEAMKEIWTKEKAEYHDRPAQTGAEAASADPRRRRFPAWRTARDPLWRWLDSRW
jgi:hypothetical protein